MIKRKSSINLADVAVAKRKIKNQFLDKINKSVNWKLIDEKINEKYTRGDRVDGRPAYPGLLLFIGLSLDDEVPSSSTVSRFRIELIKKDLYSELISMINQQLDSKNLRVRKGTLKQAAILHK